MQPKNYALTVKCPRCGSSPDVPCVATSSGGDLSAGDPITWVHAARVDSLRKK